MSQCVTRLLCKPHSSQTASTDQDRSPLAATAQPRQRHFSGFHSEKKQHKSGHASRHSWGAKSRTFLQTVPAPCWSWEQKQPWWETASGRVQRGNSFHRSSWEFVAKSKCCCCHQEQHPIFGEQDGTSQFSWPRTLSRCSDQLWCSCFWAEWPPCFFSVGVWPVFFFSVC